MVAGFRVFLAPLLNPFDMEIPLEVAGVFPAPFPLAFRLARLLTQGVRAKLLLADVAIIRQEEDVAVPAASFLDPFHDPLPPGQSVALSIGKDKEEKFREDGKKKKEELLKM